MKLLLTSSTLVLLIAATFFGGGLSSCTKDHTIYDTVTVTDTLVIKDTTLSAEILTSHSWKLLEARGVLEGQILYYYRGGSNNTQSYDNENLQFNADKTGLLLDNAGFTHQIVSWDFANNEHTKLTFSMYDAPGVISLYTWDNIKFKNNSLYYDLYYTSNYTGNDYHGQDIRIPK